MPAERQFTCTRCGRASTARTYPGDVCYECRTGRVRVKGCTDNLVIAPPAAVDVTREERLRKYESLVEAGRRLFE